MVISNLKKEISTSNEECLQDLQPNLELVKNKQYKSSLKKITEEQEKTKVNPFIGLIDKIKELNQQVGEGKVNFQEVVDGMGFDHFNPNELNILTKVTDAIKKVAKNQKSTKIQF